MLLLLPLPKTPCQKAAMGVFKLCLVMVGGIICVPPRPTPFLYATIAIVGVVVVVRNQQQCRLMMLQARLVMVVVVQVDLAIAAIYVNNDGREKSS